VSRRVNLHLAEEFAQQIEAQKPRSLALSAFCALLIEEGLTGGLSYPRTVSVREPQLGNPQAHSSTSNTEASDESSKLASINFEISSPSLLGDGIGKGVQREGKRKAKPSSPENTLKAFSATVEDVPSNLREAADELLDFWANKSGKVTERAWTLLLGQAEKIRADYNGGMKVLKEELQRAAGYGQQGLDYSRWLAYGKPRFNTPAQAKTVDWEAVDHVSFFK
jgi:hypothetical protein